VETPDQSDSLFATPRSTPRYLRQFASWQFRGHTPHRLTGFESKHVFQREQYGEAGLTVPILKERYKHGVDVRLFRQCLLCEAGVLTRAPQLGTEQDGNGLREAFGWHDASRREILRRLHKL